MRLGIFSTKLKLKQNILHCALEKTKYYAIRIEFQERDSPHAHSFIWNFDASNIVNEGGYKELVWKTVNGKLPRHLNDPERFELVKTSQVYCHTRICWKHNKNRCRIYYGHYVTENKIIAKPRHSKFINEEEQEVLTWRNILLRQAKSYIDNNLIPAKTNVIDPIKDNFTLPLSVKEILDELQISNDVSYKALSIAKDVALELHLKIEPNSYFVISYPNVDLKVCQAYMYIKPAFNQYKTVIYVFQYFSEN